MPTLSSSSMTSQPLVLAWCQRCRTVPRLQVVSSSMASGSLASLCRQQGQQRGRSHCQHERHKANALVVVDDLSPSPRCQHRDDSANALVVASSMRWPQPRSLSSTVTTDSTVGLAVNIDDAANALVGVDYLSPSLLTWTTVPTNAVIDSCLVRSSSMRSPLSQPR